MRDSVRANITFGAEYDEAHYRRALRMAALETDVEQMSHRDHTDVGESGCLLSGGQRARVAFARAVYAAADTMYLEDIFAAVDQPTSAALWASLVELHESGSTIVLVTNQAALFGRPEVGKLTPYSVAASTPTPRVLLAPFPPAPTQPPTDPLFLSPSLTPPIPHR